MVHAFDVHVPHTELVVTATSVVETGGARRRRRRSSAGTICDAATSDRYAELLAPSRYVVAEPELDEVGAELAAQHPPAEAGRQAVGWVQRQAAGTSAA